MIAPLIEVTQCPPVALDELFREHYRVWMRNTMYAGATREEAEDAISEAMLEMLARWRELREPAVYARHAVLHRFLKIRRRDRRRAQLLTVQPQVLANGEDPSLTLWEDSQWVVQLLSSLPDRQREVMAFVVDELQPKEIAELLGRSPEAVRQNLLEARKRLSSSLLDRGTGRETVQTRRKAR